MTEFDTAANFSYRPEFLASGPATALLHSLWTETRWQQHQISVFGRKVPQPRLTSWQGDSGVCYRYSGLTLLARGWDPALMRLRRKLEQEIGAEFNSVLLNAYRDGQDSMGWHSDDEKELGNCPVIASVSLGETRQFLIRGGVPKRTATLPLEHGSLLIMQGCSQSAFRHSLPKTAKASGLRINLTFRKIFIE